MPRFRVSESTIIDAPPEKVFQMVSDFGTWTTWSPWLCAEPNAEVCVSDDPNSEGSVYAWRGEIVGQGEIEHQLLRPGQLIEDEIRFLKPFKSTSQVSFEFERAGDGTKITWNMNGSLPWFMFWMVSTMQTLIGMDYNRGLKMLKEYIETGSVASRTTIRGVETVGPIKMLGVRKTCTLDQIQSSMEDAISTTLRKLNAGNQPADGEKISVYHHFDMKSKVFDYTAGVIVPKETGDAGLSSWEISQSRALAVEHVGSYAHLGNAWSAAYQIARDKKLKQSKVGAFEIYKNDPDQTAPADLRTDVFLPLK